MKSVSIWALVLTILGFTSQTYADVDILEERDWLSPGDALITYDPDTQLEWLDLSVTYGNSILDTEEEIFFERFRWATCGEVQQLLGYVEPIAYFTSINYGRVYATADPEAERLAAKLGGFLGGITGNVGISRAQSTPSYGPHGFVLGLSGGLLLNPVGGCILDILEGQPVNVPYTGLAGSWLVRQPETAVWINVQGGKTHECAVENGANISFSANTKVYAGDEVDSIMWFLDGIDIGSGTALEAYVPLGIHTIKAELTTVLGETAFDTESVEVSDTIAPEISAGFLDARTGTTITATTSPGHEVLTLMTATDACDANPVVLGTTGVPTANGDGLRAFTLRQGEHSRVTIDSTGKGVLELTVTGEDASGNMSSERAVLTVKQ